MIDERRLKTVAWRDFYHSAKETWPGDMSEQLGNVLSMHCITDTDNSGIMFNVFSNYLLILVNWALIVFDLVVSHIAFSLRLEAIID